MKNLLISLLQAAIIALGLGALTLLLWEPHLEGRNAGASFWQVYRDPFLAYAYAASAAFFVALFHAFRVLGLIGKRMVFSTAALRSLRIIRVASLVFLASIGGLILYAFIFVRGTDDIAGGVALGLMLVCASALAAAATAVFERVVRLGMENASFSAMEDE